MQTLTEPNPAELSDRLAAIESILANISLGDLPLNQLIAPTGITVTPQGTAGSTGYTYVVAAVGLVGKAPGTATATTTGNATLTATNSNKITWISQPGYLYHVYRSVSSGTPSGLGMIGAVTAAAGTAGLSTSFTDTGITATAATIPTANTTGALYNAGPIFSSGAALQAAAVPTLNNNANQTLTPSHLLNTALERTGAANISDTLPDASVLVAALRGVSANQGFLWSYRNHNTGTATLVMGTNGTSAANNTLTCLTLHAKLMLIQITATTPGSEAYTCLTLADTAM